MRVRGKFCVRSFVVVYNQNTNWKKKMQDDAEIGLAGTLISIELATDSCVRIPNNDFP